MLDISLLQARLAAQALAETGLRRHASPHKTPGGASRQFGGGLALRVHV